MAVTLRHIADRLGVSKMTVSYALRGTGGVAESTRLKVQKTAEEMGYRVNVAARAVTTKRVGQVALVQSTAPGRSFQPMELICGIHDALAEHDINLVYARLPDEKLVTEDYSPSILRELMADGLLINYRFHIPMRWVGKLESWHTPAVWIDVEREHDCVLGDEEESAVGLTTYLIERGHRRISYVDSPYGTGPEDAGSERLAPRLRRRGYRLAMERAGLPVDIWSFDKNQLFDNDTVTFHLRDRRPTGLILCDDVHARGFWYAATMQLGWRVPEDLSIATFSHHAQRLGPVIFTGILVSHREIGYRAGDLLIKKLSGEVVECTRLIVPGSLVEGNTVAPPAH